MASTQLIHPTHVSNWLDQIHLPLSTRSHVCEFLESDCRNCNFTFFVETCTSWPGNITRHNSICWVIYAYSRPDNISGNTSRNQFHSWCWTISHKRGGTLQEQWWHPSLPIVNLPTTHWLMSVSVVSYSGVRQPGSAQFNHTSTPNVHTQLSTV